MGDRNILHVKSFLEGIYLFVMTFTLFAAGKETESSLPEVTEESQNEEAIAVQETVSAESVPESNGEESVSKDDAEQQQETASGNTQSTFSYEQLRAKSENPVTGIDFKRREVGAFLRLLIERNAYSCFDGFLLLVSLLQTYLSEEEFKSIFSTTKEEFYKLPRWKQDLLKKKFDLF